MAIKDTFVVRLAGGQEVDIVVTYGSKKSAVLKKAQKVAQDQDREVSLIMYEGCVVWNNGWRYSSVVFDIAFPND